MNGDPLKWERDKFDKLFADMEAYMLEHPDATEDEAYEVCSWNCSVDHLAAIIDQQKDRRREQY